MADSAPREEGRKALLGLLFRIRECPAVALPALTTQLFSPVGEEKLLFAKVHESLPGAQDWAEGSGHLEGHEEKYTTPDYQVPGVGHAEGPTGTKDQHETEAGTDDPQGEEKESEDGHRGAGNTEEPDNWRKSHQKESREGDQSAQDAHDGAESRLESSEAGKDVEAGQAEEAAEEESANDLERSGPELVT